MAPFDPRTFPNLGTSLDTPLLTEEIRSLRGGMNNKLHATEIEIDQAMVIENTLLKQGAYAQKRAGSTDVLTPNVPTPARSGNVIGLGVWNPPTTPQEEKLIMVSQGGVATWTGTGTWASVTVGPFSGTEPVYFVQGAVTTPSFLTRAYFFQRGQSAVYEYDGTTTIASVSGAADGTDGSIPTGVDATYWLGRLWVLEDGSRNGYVSFSEFGEPRKFFPGTHAYLVNPDDDCMRIVPWFSAGLLIFQRNSIWALDIDQGNFQPVVFDSTKIELINGDIGCEAGKSVAQSGQDFFFLSRHGVMTLSRTARDRSIGRAIPISDPIEETIARINWLSAEVATGVVFDNHYYLSVPVDGSTRNNLVLDWDIREEAWSVIEGWFVGDWQVTRFPSDEERLFFGTSKNAAETGAGEVYEAFSSATTDATLAGGTADLEGLIETRSYDFGTTDQKKTPRYLDVFTDGSTDGSLEISAAPDQQAFSLLRTITVSIGQLTLPFTLPATLGNKTVQRTRVYLDTFEGVREIKFRFKMTGTGQTKILYATLAVHPHPPTWG